MPTVVLRLPAVKRQSATRPTVCRYCQGQTFQRWGAVQKPVRDPHYRSGQVYRDRNCHCHRTFRHYPQALASTLQQTCYGCGVWTASMCGAARPRQDCSTLCG